MSSAKPVRPVPSSGHPLKSVYVWIVIAVPLSAVIMGGVLLWLSISTFDGMVEDDYYQRGLQINQDLKRDEAAVTAGIAGRVQVDSLATRVSLQGSDPAFRAPAAITLNFSHATRGGLDQHLQLLQVAAGHYQGPGVSLAPGRWYLQVSAGAWRIVGSLQVGTDAQRSSTALSASRPGS